MAFDANGLQRQFTKGATASGAPSTAVMKTPGRLAC